MMETQGQLFTDVTVKPEDYPPLVKRFQSVIIDQVFIILCIVLFSMLLPNASEEDTGALRGFLLFSLFFIYEPFCMAFGCTIGNYVSGIRVRRFKHESERINLLRSYLRFITKCLLGIISFFTVTSDKWKRAIHDKAGCSIMIYAGKQ